MNHFHNILGIPPKKAIAVSQQDGCLYWVKVSAAFLFLLRMVWSIIVCDRGLNDRKRRGCISAIILPFIMLSLTHFLVFKSF